MNLNWLPGVRFLKVKAAIAYLDGIKKVRIMFLFLFWILLCSLLMCVGFILIGLSLLREFSMAVFIFGAGIVFIAAVVLGILLTQRTWIKIFGIDQLIENLKKGEKQ